MGFTTSFRMGQLLNYSLDAPAHPDGMETHEFMSTCFVDAVRACLRKGGFAKKEHEVEEGGTFLVGYRGHLFQMFGDYQMSEAACGFDACGSGANVALGALYTSPRRRPQDRLLHALEAAESLNAGVRGPFVIEVA